jgi:Na+/H+ antiporter NhaD/arsenite permease-like protein
MSLTALAALALVGLTIFGVAAGSYPRLKMNRASIALVGAVALVALQIMPPAAALKAIDANTLVLLFGMMVVAAHLRLAGFFDGLSQWLAEHTHSPRVLLACVILAAGLLAALVLNDTVVVAFTPLVLELTQRLKRDPLPYLMGLATAANIGSTATITGNPQNILIGQSSGIPYGDFLVHLGPVALIGLALAWGILVLVYQDEFRKPLAASLPQLENKIDRWQLAKCLIIIGLMLIAFLAGAPVALAGIAAAAALLVTRRTEPHAVFVQVDWPLLVLFTGLFVVTGALDVTGWSGRLFALAAPLANGGVALLALAAAALSNLISNVPAVLLFRSVVPQLADPRQAWLVLAMASTLAGNLTLLGSVANLIVAEIAHAKGVTLSFREYLRAGVPITLATLAVGIVWLSLFR